MNKENKSMNWINIRQMKQVSSNLNNIQGLIQAVFDIGIPILGTLIWACPNLMLSKTEATVKHNFSFLIKSAT